MERVGLPFSEAELTAGGTMHELERPNTPRPLQTLPGGGRDSTVPLANFGERLMPGSVQAK